MKTKAEIIDETVEYYSQNPRAIESDMISCRYMTEDGRKCAVGRCCIDPKGTWFGRAHAIRVDQRSLGELDSLLKPQYRGHPVEFWLRLQNLHDDIGNWRGNELTDRGLQTLKELRAKYA